MSDPAGWHPATGRPPPERTGTLASGTSAPWPTTLPSQLGQLQLTGHGRGITDLVEQLESDDPRTGLRAVAALRRLIDRVEELHVRHARAQGLTWMEIGRELGVTKQATHKRYAGIEEGWMFEGFTPAARDAVLTAAEVARGFGDDMIRSDHLLVGALEAGATTSAAQACVEAGVTPDAVRARIRDFFGAEAAEDVAALGIDLLDVQSRIERAFGAGASRAAGPRWERMPFSPDGKAASNQTVLEATQRGSDLVDIVDLLTAVLHPGLSSEEQQAITPGYAAMARREGLYDEENAARRVVRELGIDADALRAQLRALPKA